MTNESPDHAPEDSGQSLLSPELDPGRGATTGRPPPANDAPRRIGTGSRLLGTAVTLGIYAVLWFFTPGMLSSSLGSWISSDPDSALIIDTAAALVILLVLVTVHPVFNRNLFAPSWQRISYLLPVLAGLALPLHYSGSVPLLLYLVWMPVFVFWQIYLTFGLLQSHLTSWLSARASATITAIAFYGVHALYLPRTFAIGHFESGSWQPWAALLLIALGALFAYLRYRLRAIHLLIALHLTFYFIAT